MAPSLELFAQKFNAFLDKIKPKLEALTERFGNWLAGIDWNKVIDGVEALADRFTKWLENIDWNKIINDIETIIEKLQQFVQVLGGVKSILIDIAAIKVFGWVAGIAGWVIKLKALTTALTAAKAAAAAGGAADAAAGAGAASGAGSTVLGLGTSIAARALGVAGMLLYSPSLGGKRRADGTYSDELSNAQIAATAKAARAEQAKHTAQAMAYFTAQGWSRQQAAGIVANLVAESWLRTNKIGDNGNAYGIAQWHKDRQAAFEKFTGHSIQGSTLAEQLAFVNHELQTSEKRAGGFLRRAGNPYVAGLLVSELYERPLGGQVEAERRALMAQQLLNVHRWAPANAARVAGPRSSTSTNSVTITNMTVNTKATDAKGVAKGMKTALLNEPLIAGFATSLA